MPALQNSSKSLRLLGPLEEFFWRSGISWPTTIYVTAHVESLDRRLDWRRGADAVQAKYEHLRITVKKQSGFRPAFVPAVAPLAVQVLPWEGQGVFSAPYYVNDANLGYYSPLFASFLIFEGEQRAQVTLALNHCVIDGLGALAILQDFFAAVAGEKLTGRVSLSDSVNSLFGVDCPEAYVPTKSHPPIERYFSDPCPHIAEAVAASSTTERLRTTARTNGTTIQGALVAAFFTAARQCRHDWRERDLVCLSPFDARRVLGGEDADAQGVLIGVQPLISKAENCSDFWEVARRAKKDIVAGLEPEALKQGLKHTCEIVAEDGDPTNPDSIDPRGLLAHELMVTNMGTPNLRTDFGAMKLCRVFPAVCGGPDSWTQTISVLTINGEMCFTHLSPSPIKALLPTAMDILRRACNE